MVLGISSPPPRSPLDWELDHHPNDDGRLGLGTLPALTCPSRGKSSSSPDLDTQAIFLHRDKNRQTRAKLIQRGPLVGEEQI